MAEFFTYLTQVIAVSSRIVTYCKFLTLSWHKLIWSRFRKSRAKCCYVQSITYRVPGDFICENIYCKILKMLNSKQLGHSFQHAITVSDFVSYDCNISIYNWFRKTSKCRFAESEFCAWYFTRLPGYIYIYIYMIYSFFSYYVTLASYVSCKCLLILVICEANV